MHVSKQRFFMGRGSGLTKRREMSVEDISERDVETSKIVNQGLGHAAAVGMSKGSTYFPQA